MRVIAISVIRAPKVCITLRMSQIFCFWCSHSFSMQGKGKGSQFPFDKANEPANNPSRWDSRWKEILLQTKPATKLLPRCFAHFVIGPCHPPSSRSQSYRKTCANPLLFERWRRRISKGLSLPLLWQLLQLASYVGLGISIASKRVPFDWDSFKGVVWLVNYLKVYLLEVSLVLFEVGYPLCSWSISLT